MKKDQNNHSLVNDSGSEFWDNNDFTDFLQDFTEVNLDLSNLKPSTKSVTIRLPESLLKQMKIIANKKDVPYQSLAKIWLAEKIKEEYSK